MKGIFKTMRSTSRATKSKKKYFPAVARPNTSGKQAMRAYEV